MKRFRILSKTFNSGELGITISLINVFGIFIVHVSNIRPTIGELILYLLLTSLNPCLFILEGKYYLDIIFYPEREISGKIVELEGNYNLLKKRFGTKCDRYVVLSEEKEEAITLYCYKRVYDFNRVAFAEKRRALPNYIKCRYLRFTRLITAVEYVEYPEVLIEKRRKRKNGKVITQR